jgi:hypothetical protein
LNTNKRINNEFINTNLDCNDHANSNESKMNQCNKSVLVEKTINRRSRGKGTAASLFFFAVSAGIRGINDKVGGVGSHDLNNSPTK